MSILEIAGRITHFVLHPVIFIAIRNSRRSYIVAECDGKILLVKNVIGSGKWHLPGGGCHTNESYAQGAIREFNKEVGVSMNESDLEHIEGGPWRSGKIYEYDLFKLSLDRRVELRIDKKEILKAEWINPEKLNEGNASETVLRAVEC